MAAEVTKKGLVIACLVIYIVVGVNGQTNKFMRFRTAVSQTNKTLKLYDNAVFDWHAGNPPMLIGLYGRSSITIRLNCELHKLLEDYKTTRFVLYDPRRLSYTDLSSGKAKYYENDVVATYDELTGGIITINFDVAKTEYPKEGRLLLACAYVSSRHGDLYSSTIEVIDYRRYVYYKRIRTYTEKPFNASEPKTFKAFPKKFKMIGLLSPPTFGWFYTDVAMKDIKNETKGTSVFDIEPFDTWPVQIQWTGYLYWSFMTEKAVETLKGKRIFARVEETLLGIFDLPTAISSSGGNEVTKLEIFEPSIDGEKLAFRSGSLPTPRVRCSFKSGPGKVEISWKMDGLPLKSGYNSLQKVNVWRNYVDFVGPFYFTSWVGSLACTVKWWRKTGAPATETKSWSINQTNIIIPRLADELPTFAIVPNGGDAKITCTYKQVIGIETSANIYGDAHNYLFDKGSTSEGALEFKLKLLGTLNKLYLNVSLSPKCCPMDPTKPVVYRAFNLTNNGHGISDSHTFSCMAKVLNDSNIKPYDELLLRRQVLVTVLPTISLNITPSKWNYNDSDPCDKNSEQITMSYQVTDEMNIPQIRTVFQWFIKGESKKPIPSSMVDSEQRFVSKLKLCELLENAKELDIAEKDASNFTGEVICTTQLIDKWGNRELFTMSDSVMINVPFKEESNVVLIVVVVVVVLILVGLAVGIVWWFKFKGGTEVIENLRKSKGTGINNSQPEGRAMLERNTPQAV